MFGFDIQCLPGDCVAATLLKCLKGSIKVDRVLEASSIAWYLQHITKEEYDAEQANYETQDPQAKYRLWEVFVRNAILVQILETKPRNRRIEFYDKGVLRGYGIRKVPGRKKGQPNQEFDEARLGLAQRADDEYRRYCERHPHRSGRNGRRGLQNDPVLEDKDANSPAMLYEELFIEIDQSCYAIKRCAESMMDRKKGHKHSRDPVSKAAPPTRPAPVHHRPGASPPESSRHDIAPPIAPVQEGGGSLSPSSDERASPANGRRGSSRASGQSAAFPSHGGSREPAQGSGHSEAMSSGSPHQQPTRRSEKSHRPAASPTPSPRDPSSGSSSASSDRHTTSSIASSRVSSRAPSHAHSGTIMGNRASPIASNERSGRPPQPNPDGGSNGEGKPVATTNDYLSVGGQPHLSSGSGSRRATRFPRPQTRERQSEVTFHSPRAVAPAVLYPPNARTTRSGQMSVVVLQAVAPIAPRPRFQRAKSWQLDLEPSVRPIAVSHRVMKVILRAYQVGIQMGDEGFRSGEAVKVLPGRGQAVTANELDLTRISRP